MYFEVDSILAMPVTCASLFDEKNRAYLLSWPIAGQDISKEACEILVPSEGLWLNTNL